jgi:hypothetical protein
MRRRYLWVMTPNCGGMMGAQKFESSWSLSFGVSWRQDIAPCPECVCVCVSIYRPAEHGLKARVLGSP